MNGHGFDERLGEDVQMSPLERLAHESRYLFAAAHVQDRTALDLACGTGYGSRILAQYGAREVTGIDLSESALDEGRRLHAHPRVRLIRGDAFDPPVRQRFDVVVSFETIEHVPTPERLLDVLVDLVDPSGTFICSTPNRAVTNPGTTRHDRPANPYHMTELNQSEFREELRSRFRDVTVYGQIYPLPTGRVTTGLVKRAEERLAYATTWPIRLPLRSVYMVAVCRGPRR